MANIGFLGFYGIFGDRIGYQDTQAILKLYGR